MYSILILQSPLGYNKDYYYFLMKNKEIICGFQYEDGAKTICDILNICLEQKEVLEKKCEEYEEFIECLKKLLVEASSKGFIPSDVL